MNNEPQVGEIWIGREDTKRVQEQEVVEVMMIISNDGYIEYKLKSSNSKLLIGLQFLRSIDNFIKFFEYNEKLTQEEIIRNIIE